MPPFVLIEKRELLLERERGLAPQEAIREACRLRLRPILMTTMAAMLGAIAGLAGQMWPVFRRFDGERGNTVSLGIVTALSFTYAPAWILLKALIMPSTSQPPNMYTTIWFKARLVITRTWG